MNEEGNMRYTERIDCSMDEYLGSKWGEENTSICGKWEKEEDNGGKKKDEEKRKKVRSVEHKGSEEWKSKRAVSVMR